MKTLWKGNKKYWLGGLVLLMLILGSCSNMSDREMEKYCDYESEIRSMDMDSKQIKKRVDEYIEKFDVPDIQYTLRLDSNNLKDFKNQLKEYNERLDSINTAKFKKFYKNVPEYRGTNKKEEQDNYETTKDEIFMIKRRYAFYSEIISYILDDELTKDEREEVEYLQKLYSYDVNEKVFTDEDIERHNEIYEKYNIDLEV